MREAVETRFVHAERFEEVLPILGRELGQFRLNLRRERNDLGVFGIRRERCGERGEDSFYYVTLYNENWPQPAKADGVEDGVLRGLYRFRA